MLVLFRPFHIGDRIETGGVSGTMCVLNLFHSEIDDDDGTRVVIQTVGRDRARPRTSRTQPKSPPRD